jgi:apolipoprotein N-acyltransferase
MTSFHSTMPVAIDPTLSMRADNKHSLLMFAQFLLFPVATAVMLTLTFPPANLKVLAWIALVPLGIVLCSKRLSLEMYLGLYLGGLVFQLATLDWVRSGSGAMWLSGPRATQWLAQGTGLALIWPLFMVTVRPFVTLRLPMTLSLPIVWIAFEFSRKHLWVIVDTVGYPFGQLGLTQTNYPHLIQVADLGGVYAVSALVASVNGLIVDLIFWVRARNHNVSIPLAPAAGLALAIGATWLYGYWRLSQPVVSTGPIVGLMPRASLSALNIVALPTNDARGTSADANAVTKLQQQDALVPRTDLLIWSEVNCAIVDPEELVHAEARNRTTIDRIEQFARLADASLVIGCSRKTAIEGAGSFNSAIIVDPGRGCVGFYDKLRLVPFSEFHPPGRKWFGTSDMYVPGSGHPVFKIKCGSPSCEFQLAASVCYDTCFPDLFWEYMRPSSGRAIPQFFVVAAFEDFDHAMRLQDNLLQLARFRAVECRRAFVRNSHRGYSGIIDGNGALIAAPPVANFSEPVVLGPIPLDQRFSLYSVIGDWPAAMCVGTVFIAALFKLINRPTPLTTR